MSGYGHASHPRLSGGSATETVYGLIRDGKHEECAGYLEAELANAPAAAPRSPSSGTACLGNFDAAASYYERLCRASGKRRLPAPSRAVLFKASAYPEALRATKQIEDPTLTGRVPLSAPGGHRLRGGRHRHVSRTTRPVPAVTPTSPSTPRAACSRRASSRRRAPSSRTRSRRSGTRLIWRTTRCVTTA